MEATHFPPQYPHSGVGGGEEQQQEKTPVLKKVKEKVRKVKDKISKKRHGHEENPEHGDGDDDVSVEEDEEYEEDEEEKRVDPAVHGAPRGGDLSLGEVVAMTQVEEDSTVPKAADQSILLYPSATEAVTGMRRNLVRDRDENQDPEKVGLMVIAGRVDEDPPAPKVSGSVDVTVRSTGGDEVGESPILSSFQAMSVSDTDKGKHDVGASPPAGTHDQFSADKPQQLPNPKQEETEEQHHKTPTYTEKIASTTTATKNAAVSAAIGSTEYGKKIASTVYEKVSELKSGRHPEKLQPEQGMQPDKGVSVKEYIAEKLRPGDEDRALSEVITGTIEKKKEKAKRSSDAESSSGGGKGMVEKIRGAVSSWLGAGSVPENGSGHAAAASQGTGEESIERHDTRQSQ